MRAGCNLTHLHALSPNSLNLTSFLRGESKLHTHIRLKKNIYIYVFPHDATALSGPGTPNCRDFTTTHRHTTLWWTPLE